MIQHNKTQRTHKNCGAHVLKPNEISLRSKRFFASSSRMLGQEQKIMNDGGGGGGKKETLARKRVHLYVEGRGSRVEGNNFFNFFFLKMKNNWKTNKKN